MIQSACLCGGVSWRSPGPLTLVTLCHCSICRRSHGTAFGLYGFAPSDGFEWTKGRDLVRGYESSPGFVRPFCGRCGSVVAGEPRDGLVAMPIGCVVEGDVPKPVAHIFTGSKAAWHPITDDLPQFEAYPPGFDAKVVEGPQGDATEGRVRAECLCGGVAWQIEGELEFVRLCHCSRCRRARAAPFATNGFIDLEKFSWLRGESLLESYKVPEAKRFSQVFCRVCGSPAPRLYGRLGFGVLPVGAFMDDPGGREREHIFVGSMADWWEITDDLEQYEEGTP